MTFVRGIVRSGWQLAVLAALAGGVLLGSVEAVSAQSSPQTSGAEPAPATQPVFAPRREQDIVSDYQATSSKLGEVLGSVSSFSDPAKRAEVGPKAIPILNHLNDLLSELLKLQPLEKDQVEEKQQTHLFFLSLFGDKAASDRLQQMADSADENESTRGRGSQLRIRWVISAKDAGAQGKVADDIEKIARAHPGSEELTGQIISMSQLDSASQANSDRMLALVTDVMKNQVADGARQEIDSMRKLRGLEGQALEIKGKTTDGKDFTTSSWKGKVVLVDFWATWCGPCVAELPHVKKVYADYHAKGLEVLGVSNDYSADDLKKFLADSKDMPWTQLFDPAAAQQQEWNPITLGFGIEGIPAMFLIDKKGIVRTVNASDMMDDLIPKMLAE